MDMTMASKPSSLQFYTQQPVTFVAICGNTARGPQVTPVGLFSHIQLHISPLWIQGIKTINQLGCLGEPSCNNLGMDMAQKNTMLDLQMAGHCPKTSKFGCKCF